MNIQTKDKIGLSEVQKATYFGLCYRYQTSLKAAAVVLLVAVAYLIYQLTVGA